MYDVQEGQRNDDHGWDIIEAESGNVNSYRNGVLIATLPVGYRPTKV